uniref:Relaxin family peptide receptor 2 n=1 Tax=Rhipicephalus appendiculatus TaxID=34631 RepID=A0A131YI75_RHIAP
MPPTSRGICWRLSRKNTMTATVLLQLSAMLCSSAATVGTPTEHSCPEGHFPCSEARRHCVRRQFICDGHRDCPEGSDEKACGDENLKKFIEDYFQKRPDEDREKKSEACDEIHRGCRCSKNNNSFFCENTGLRALPQFLKTIPQNVTNLDISGNHFSKLQKSDFPLMPQLTILSLSSSEVISLDEDVFGNLPMLKKVYLQGNRIRHIAADTFVSNKNLRNLYLSHNPIESISADAFRGLTALETLDLRSCSLTGIQEHLFVHPKNLTHLWLDGNDIESLQPRAFSHLSRLQVLSLTRNKLVRLSAHDFTGLVSLRTLNLAYNKLSDVTGAFTALGSLRTLDLEGNRLDVIPDDTFWPLRSVESLNLRNNVFRTSSSALFAPLRNITHIYFSDFSLCSSALHVRVCEPRGDGISSLAHLLDSVVLRVAVWVVALVACLGNLLVLVGRLVLREPNAVHSFYIKNLALADLIMGVYLFVIASHDVAFRGEYIRHDYRWRRSVGCSVSGFLSTVSSEASVFTLTVITVDRFASIVYPLSLKRRTFRFAWICMLCVWLVTLLLAAVPMMRPDYYGEEFYGSNGVCLPLHIHDPDSKGWEYSAFVFCIVNSVAFAFIAYAYLTMFVTITHSKVGLRSTQQLQDRAIAKRFAFIVGTDFLCWMPIVFIKIIAIAGTKIDETLYAWVAVFLLPVNSALNPVLYTLTTRMFKQQLNRFLDNLRQCERVPSYRQSGQSGQSWSSVPTVRGQKKTLVTSLSECTFGKKKTPTAVCYPLKNGAILPLRASQSCVEKVSEPTQEEMKTFPTRNGHAGANDSSGKSSGTNSSGKSLLSTKSASGKSKWKRHLHTRLRAEDSL